MIGQVTSTDEESALQVGQRAPVANLQGLDIVQVLTAASGTRPANLNSAVAALPQPGQEATRAAGGEQLASTGAGG